VSAAINAANSVSRVGGSAQIKAMRDKWRASCGWALEQYRELAEFAPFGSDLDKSTQHAAHARRAPGRDPQASIMMSRWAVEAPGGDPIRRHQRLLDNVALRRAGTRPSSTRSSRVATPAPHRQPREKQLDDQVKGALRGRGEEFSRLHCEKVGGRVNAP